MWIILDKVKLNKGRAGYKVQCECGYIGFREQRNVDSGRTTCCKSCSGKNTAIKTFDDNSFFNKKHKGVGELSKTRFSRIRHGAKLRELEFNITIEEIWNLFIKQNRKCALSGIILKFKDASLDRIDNNKGYIFNNTQWVHVDINFMKQAYDQDYFIKTCELIYKNSITGKGGTCGV